MPVRKRSTATRAVFEHIPCYSSGADRAVRLMAVGGGAASVELYE